MKQVLVYFGLFLTFVGFMSGTQHLDAYSAQYVECAEAWKSAADRAEHDLTLQHQLLKKIDNGNMELDGEVCPALRADHAELLRLQLNASPLPAQFVKGSTLK